MEGFYLVIIKKNFYIIKAESEEEAIKKFKYCNNADDDYEIRKLPNSPLFWQVWEGSLKKYSSNNIFIANP